MDPFNLLRFLHAQDRSFEVAVGELRGGVKRSHWIWFIFPQMQGLGRSANSHFYGIASREEAVAYLLHPVLGLRLVQCVSIVNELQERSALQIFGEIDASKFCSSMTLFEAVDETEGAFGWALEKYFGGERDSRTLGLLG